LEKLEEQTQLFLHCATCGCGKLEVVVNKEDDTLLIGCPECLKSVALVSLPEELKKDVAEQGCAECGCGKAH